MRNVKKWLKIVVFDMKSSWMRAYWTSQADELVFVRK
jgi:hypothetical protein